MGFVPGINTEIETFLTELGAQQIMTQGVGVIKYFAVCDDASNYDTLDPLTFNQVFTLAGKLGVNNKIMSVVNGVDLKHKIFVDTSTEVYKSFETDSGGVILEEDMGGPIVSNFYNIYPYEVDKTVNNYQLNWIMDSKLPYGIGDNLLWGSNYNVGGYANTAISDMSTNQYLFFVLDGLQHAFMDGKSIKFTIPYFSTTIDLYGTYFNTNMNRNYYNSVNSEGSMYTERFGSNVVFLFSDDISRPNGGDPTRSWSTGYNLSSPYTSGNKSLANFISNGSSNKDTAVGIVYLDKGVIVIFKDTIYSGYVNRTNNNISVQNKNLVKRTTANFICDLPLGKFYRSQNPTYVMNRPVRISSVGLYNENKELMAVGRLNSEVEKNIAQRLTFLVKLVI